MSSLVTYTGGDSDGEFSDGEIRDFKISDEDEDTGGSETGGSEGRQGENLLILDTADSNNSQMSNDSFLQQQKKSDVISFRTTGGVVRPAKRRRGLVSYSPLNDDERRDDLEEGEDIDNDEEDDTEGTQVELLIRQDSEDDNHNNSPSHHDDASQPPEIVVTTPGDSNEGGGGGTEFDVELPPEPIGRCSRKVQDKFTQFYEKMRRQDLNMNESIKRRKDFRNPSIYQKLVEFCGIDEKGSNYPKELFDPHSWGDNSFYESLAKAQKELMTKLEKEKKEKTKVEFLTGTVKKPSGVGSQGSTATDELPAMKQRKSKWDVPVSTSSSSSIPPVAIAKSVSIPGVGTLTKKIKLDTDDGNKI